MTSSNRVICRQGRKLAHVDRQLYMGPYILLLCFHIGQCTCNLRPHLLALRNRCLQLFARQRTGISMLKSTSCHRLYAGSSCILSKTPLTGRGYCRTHIPTHTAVVCPFADWRTMHGLSGLRVGSGLVLHHWSQLTSLLRLDGLLHRLSCLSLLRGR